MRPQKILFANFPADGHFNPLTGLAVHLKNMGHDVRWYTGKKYQGKVEELAIPFFPVKRAIDFSVEDFDQLFPARKFQQGAIGKLKFDIKHSFVLRGPEYYEDITEINESFRFDLLVADNCFTGLPFVRQLLKKPAVAIGVVPMIETSKDLPPVGLGITPSATFFGKRVQDLLRFVMDRFVFRDSRKLIDQIYSQYGMRTAKGNVFDIISREADLLLQSGTPGFEYQRSDLRSNTHFIGPLLPFSKRKDKAYRIPAQYRQFEKRILVTQGTVETDIEKIIVPTLEAFKCTDVLVIVTTGGSQTQQLRARYPHSNILIDDFIPFNDIMPECDAFITNGGYGGVLLSIQNKLPMVAAGVHEGKNEINARIGYFGLGINLKTERPAPSQLRTNVDLVMRDRSYRQNVARLADEFEKYVPEWLCEKYVNQLLERRGNTDGTFLRLMRKVEQENTIDLNS